MSDAVWPDRFCSSCRARPGEPCITNTGRQAPKPHKPRLAEQDAPAGRKPTGDPSPATRQALGRRSRGMCEFTRDGVRCPRPARHAHHVRRRSQGGTNELENLKHLCTSHHEFCHKYVEWSYDNGYLERTSA